MESRHLRMILRHAAAAAGCPNGAPLSDRELLDRFRQNRDEAAFAELVHRYGRLVWAVCRNLVASEADASDAFQATFLALVQNADRIQDPARLAAWLHGVAYRVCSKARRQIQRRRARERRVAVREAGQAIPDSSWDRAMAAVHEEVSRLPESLRVPFVLCCLEGKGTTEAAEQLGWKLGTLSGRLSRAKVRLLANLDRRGLAIGAAVAATAGASANSKVPAIVAERAIHLLRHGVSIPNSILNLSQGVVGMTAYRTKLLAAMFGIMAIGLTTGVGSGWLSRADAQGKDELRKSAAEAVGQLKQPQSTWEYRYEPVAAESHPASFADATRRLEANAVEGWEFCGTMEMSLSPAEFQKLSRGGKPSGSGVYRVAVYKRPAQAGLKRKVESLAAEKLIDELTRALAEAKRGATKQGEYERDYRRTVEQAERALQETREAQARAEQQRAAAVEEKRRAIAEDQKKRAAADEYERALRVGKQKAALEEQVKALQAELEALKMKKLQDNELKLEKQNLETLRDSLKGANLRAIERANKLPPRDSGASAVYKLRGSNMDSGEIIKLAVAAAQKKFGKGSVDVSVNAKDPRSQDVLVSGQPEAVKWMINLLKKLEE